MNEYSKHNVTVAVLLLILLLWVLPAQQMAGTERLLCQWKITVWFALHMCMCKRKVRQDSSYLITFKTEKESK